MSHGEFLRQQSGDPELASHVMHDYAEADLDPQTRTMLDFATKLTRAPSSMSEADVEVLRGSGLSDEQILSVVLITALFNFGSRLTNGLGVEFPQRRQKSIEKWLIGPATLQEWLMSPKS